MARVRANNAKAAVAADMAAVYTNFLNGCFYFHIDFGLTSPRYPSAAAVRIQLKLDLIADQNFDTMQTHFTGQVREYQIAGLKLHAK